MDGSKNRTAVVLAAHGAPPTDYPRMRVGLLMLLEFSPRPVRRTPLLRALLARLEKEVAGWPRTEGTDPYKAAVDALAGGLSRRLEMPVFPGYNEFCCPTVGEALERAIWDGAQTVLVVPTMLLRGNAHTESEIRRAVIETAGRHPEVTIEYAWPFSEESMVSLFAGQVLERLAERSEPPAGTRPPAGTQSRQADGAALDEGARPGSE